MKTIATISISLLFVLISIRSYSQANTSTKAENKTQTGVTKKASSVESQAKSDNIVSKGEKQNNAKSDAAGIVVSGENASATKNKKFVRKESKKMSNVNYIKK